jgi:hypothetical protein
MYLLRASWLVMCPVLVGSVTPPAIAVDYTFTRIADSSGPVQPGEGSINNAGKVAFVGSRSNGGDGVYLLDGGIVTPLLANYGGVTRIGRVRLNDNGAVAYVADRSGNPAGIYVVPAGGSSATQVAGAGLRDLFWDFDFNNRGQVVFEAQYRPGEYAYFVTDGKHTNPVHTWPGNGIEQPATVNDSGTVAFSMPLVGGNGEIYTGDGSSPASRPGLYGTDPSINNAGRIAYVFRGAGEQAVMLSGPEGRPVRIAGTTDGTFLARPTVNANGEVGFTAFGTPSDSQLDGVYVGDGSRLDRVLGPGDTLFGGTVRDLILEDGNLIDSGQLLITYLLTDGTIGLTVATPVPEPECAAAAFEAGLLLLARRRNRSVSQL